MTHKQKGSSFVSLFTGAMGLDIGLEQAGFSVAVCNEIDKASIKTIRTNKPDVPVVEDPVEAVDVDKLSERAGFDIHGIDLVAGGPPCQSFSVYGNRNGIQDGRGKLIYHFIRLVDEIRPRSVLMENVRGLHSIPVFPPKLLKDGEQKHLRMELTEKGSLFREMTRRFEDIGYRLDYFLVNSVNYGAPQIRERLLCVGNRFNLEASFPHPRYSNRQEDGLPPFATLGDAIGGDFVDPDPTLMNFSPRKLRYLSMVPPGGNWRSLPVDVQKESMGKSWHLKGGRSATWRKLSFEFPSPTVVTMPNHASTSMCHPSELRALTVGECAAIQEFSSDWRFEGTPAERYRQAGNAVPIRLGAVAGEVLKELIVSIDHINTKRRQKNTIPSAVYHIRPHVRTRSFWRNGKALAGNHDYYIKKSDDTSLPLFDKLKG